MKAFKFQENLNNFFFFYCGINFFRFDRTTLREECSNDSQMRTSRILVFFFQIFLDNILTLYQSFTEKSMSDAAILRLIKRNDTENNIDS